MNKFISEVTNEDCMEGMARYPDKYFDLAIVDPPYGINIATEIDRSGFKEGSSRNSLSKYESSMLNKIWDNSTPSLEYFNELFRISKNQIIWGGNYFDLKPTKCFVVWDKMTYIPTMSQIELAWTSIKKHSQLVKINSNQLDRFHPTQKPVALYKWLLHNYANQGDKILDTHLGSGSSRIAAYEMGFDFTAFELDTEYFEAQEKRYKAHIAQLKLELI